MRFCTTFTILYLAHIHFFFPFSLLEITFYFFLQGILLPDFFRCTATSKPSANISELLRKQSGIIWMDLPQNSCLMQGHKLSCEIILFFKIENKAQTGCLRHTAFWKINSALLSKGVQSAAVHILWPRLHLPYTSNGVTLVVMLCFCWF